MNNIKIAGVVVLYKPTDDDIKNIDSYINDIDLLYVIDNTPDARNDERLPKNKKIKYIFNNKNLGVAEALNIAATNAIKNNFEWLLTMDQDTNFRNGVIVKIKKIIEVTDTSNIGIVTPWHSTKLKIEKLSNEIDYPLDVMTSGNFLNLNIYKKIGGFKNWLFIDGVDMEYCLNLAKNEYKIMRINYLEIDHNLGNIKYKKFLWQDLLITNHSAMRRYYQCRNYHYIKDMYIDTNKEYCTTLVKLKAIIIGIVFFEKNKIKKILAIFRGYHDYKKDIKGGTYSGKN